MSSSRIDADETLLPVIPIVHVGCAGIDTSELVGDAAITGAIVVPDPGTVLIGINKVKVLFFLRLNRQFGQVFSRGVMGAPQRGQVLGAI